MNHGVELRRLHLDLIFCYKMVFGLACVNFNDFFSSLALPQLDVDMLINYLSLDVRQNFLY